MKSDRGGAKCVRLDYVRAGLQIVRVNLFDDVRLGQIQKLETALEILPVPVAELFPAIVGFGQFTALDHGAHGAVEHDDPLREGAAQRDEGQRDMLARTKAVFVPEIK